MSDSGRIVDAGALQDRLPAGWIVETVCGANRAEDGAGGERVCGYEDGGESVSRENANRRGTAFELRCDENLWTATWLDRRGPSADSAAVHRVTGVKERCVEWVIDRARGAEETEGG